MSKQTNPEHDGRYGWYVLIVLSLVNMMNYHGPNAAFGSVAGDKARHRPERYSTRPSYGVCIRDILCVVRPASGAPCGRLGPPQHYQHRPHLLEPDDRRRRRRADIFPPSAGAHRPRHRRGGLHTAVAFPDQRLRARGTAPKRLCNLHGGLHGGHYRGARAWGRSFFADRLAADLYCPGHARRASGALDPFHRARTAARAP